VALFIQFYGRARSLAGWAFGTRFFICPAEQIKRAQTMPLSLTQVSVISKYKFHI
jgi:hypothetical protein